MALGAALLFMAIAAIAAALPAHRASLIDPLKSSSLRIVGTAVAYSSYFFFGGYSERSFFASEGNLPANLPGVVSSSM